MLSYQHGYHAGNFADVVKHLTLTRIFHYLLLKEKPLLYLETHSGRGLYDLYDAPAQKTQEYTHGIAAVWKHRKQLSPLFTPYLQHLKTLNRDELRYYGGSPSIAIHTSRRIDRLAFYERHPREFSYLSTQPKLGKRISFHEEEGLKALLSMLPPPERRAFIFIDPSYEIKEDYKDIPKALQQAYKRFSTGLYCVWYPILDPYQHAQFVRRLGVVSDKKWLKLEFMFDKNAPGMKGCGLWIINPPFTLAKEMEEILSTLTTLLNPPHASYIIEQGSQ